MTLTRPALDDAFRAHERYLWGLCYRMTGVAADADELVQETFVRAMERSPSADRPLRPWLTRVAMNLSQDRLRRRRRRRYTGPWLPSPVDVGSLVASPPAPDARVGVAESLSYAFLLALEALTARQRGVLLLRDVFDLTVAETAELLEMSASNVKVTLHRARRALAAADPERSAAPADHDRVMAALGALLACMAAGDLDGARALFTEDAVLYTDGGEFRAARVAVSGPERILRFIHSLSKLAGADMTTQVRIFNGAPALVGAHTPTYEGQAPRWVNRVDLDGAGRIRVIHSVLASDRLTAAFPG